jgi:hypothetical protein
MFLTIASAIREYRSGVPSTAVNTDAKDENMQSRSAESDNLRKKRAAEARALCESDKSDADIFRQMLSNVVAIWAGDLTRSQAEEGGVEVGHAEEGGIGKDRAGEGDEELVEMIGRNVGMADDKKPEEEREGGRRKGIE